MLNELESVIYLFLKTVNLKNEFRSQSQARGPSLEAAKHIPLMEKGAFLAPPILLVTTELINSGHLSEGNQDVS